MHRGPRSRSSPPPLTHTHTQPTPTGAASFSEALRQPGCPLERLDLSDCEAGDGAAVALSSALMEATSQAAAGRQQQHGGGDGDGGGSRSGSRSRVACPPGPLASPPPPRTGPLTHLDLSSNQLTLKGEPRHECIKEQIRI